MNLSSAPTAVGRTAERESLKEVLAAGTRGSGAIVLVEGEAGIGKTHLLRLWMDEAGQAGVAICHAVGRELEQDRPFGVMTDALAVSPDSSDPERTAVAKLLSGAPAAGSELDGFQDARYAVVELLAGIVERMALGQPSALILDDLQWCDASSLITLGRAFRLAADLPLIVLCAYRPRPSSAELGALLRTPEAERARRISLGPLDQAAVTELVAEIAGGDPGPGLTGQALRCGGNPLFVTKLVGALRQEGLLEPTEAGVDLISPVGSSPPPAVSMLVLRHLSTLPGTTIDLVRLGAVLGSPFSLRDLGLATGSRTSELLGELQPALKAGLLLDAGTGLAFQHDLVRDAIYDDLGEGLRRALHRQLADALAAASAPARQVAFHLAAAAETLDPAAADWLLRAGREAAPRDPVAAVTLLRQALDLAGPGSPTDVIRLTLGQALAAAGRLREAEDLLRELIAGGDEAPVTAQARAALGQVLHLFARFDEAAKELAAAALSPALSEAARARLFAHSVMDRIWSGERADQGEPDARRALAEARRVGDRLAEFYGLVAQLSIAQQRGWIREAAQLARDAGSIAEAVAPEDEITHYEMPPVHARLDADLFEEALETLSSSPAWNEERGGAVQPRRHFEQMCCHTFLGAWDDAVADGESALLLARESGTVWMTDSSRAILALLLARRDELVRAGALLAELRAEKLDADPVLRLAGAYLAAAQGDEDGARAILGSAPGSAGEDIWVLRNWGSLLAQLYLALNDRDGIRAIARRLEPVAERASVPSLDGLVVLCRGMAEGNSILLVEAADALRSTPRALDLAAACEEAGAATSSTALLNEALELYEGFGARRDAARTVARLRALGVRPGRPGMRNRPTVGWASLTTTERRVAELVEEGLLYKEIGNRLFISRRTVETHVAHIFGKLGVASRLELSRAVRQQVGQGSQ